MNLALLHNDIQVFINNNLKGDISKLLFKKSPFPSVSTKELAEQIESKRQSEKKLPTWLHAEGIYYPPKLSIEQASSEITAEYKSNLTVGETLIDLTGGFGVDSFFFSKKVHEITHCEITPELSSIAKHNAKVLNADNISFIPQDGISYLKNSTCHYNTIFIDPSRRVKTQKVFLFKDCEPDVTAHAELFLLKSDRIIIKTSPLYDIVSGLRELKNVSEIHIVSVKNDCKEILWIIDKNHVAEPEVVCAALTEKEITTFRFKLSQERETEILKYYQPEHYLYEPDVCLLKGGCFKLIAKEFNLKKLHPNTHLYTSTDLVNTFLGRKFKVTSVLNYSDFNKVSSIKKANIISRNFPLSPEELKKKHKITDGGENYLIFTTGPNGNYFVIETTRI